MKVVIVEDELPAQRMLKEMLEELNFGIEVTACLNSVKKAVKWFKNNPHPEIALLDIQLADGISFDILNQVKIESMIIFTTAFDEYAIQAFKVNSIDYLLKPIDPDELEAAFQKHQNITNKNIQQPSPIIDYSEIASIISSEKKEYRKRFLIQSNEAFSYLDVNDIAYFYSLQGITFGVTFSKREYPLNFSLESLKEQLNPDTFFKANRQFIINLNSIKKIHMYFQGKLKIETIPAHSEDIIVGKDKAASFKRWLDK